MEFVELGNSGFEREFAAGDLEPLDEIGGTGKQYAPAVFDESEAERCRKMALAPSSHHYPAPVQAGPTPAASPAARA